MDAGQDIRACDVVIIGAGLSGLYAARALAAAGVDVLVLEAQNRVGSRTRTTHLADGTCIDEGGQWVSPGQDHIVQLAAALGVALFPGWREGLTVDWHNGQRSTYHGLFPPGDPAVAATACAGPTACERGRCRYTDSRYTNSVCVLAGNGMCPKGRPRGSGNGALERAILPVQRMDGGLALFGTEELVEI